MSVHQDYPENVPSAKHGTADSLAAPGRVGAGGTSFRDLCGMFVDMPVFRACMAINVVVLIVLVSRAVLPGMIAKTPFAIVTDWADFSRFVLLYWIGKVPA